MADRPSLLPVAVVSLTGLLLARAPTPSVADSRQGQYAPAPSGPKLSRENGNPACCGTYTLKPLAEFLGRPLKAMCPQDATFQKRTFSDLLHDAQMLDV